MQDLQIPRYQTRLIPAYYDNVGGSWFIFTTDKKFIPVAVLTINKENFETGNTPISQVALKQCFFNSDKQTNINYDLLLHPYTQLLYSNNLTDYIENDLSLCTWWNTMYLYKSAFEININSIDTNNMIVFLKVVVDNTQPND